MLQDKQNTKRPVNDEARNKGVVAHGKIVVAFHRFFRASFLVLQKSSAKGPHKKLMQNCIAILATHLLKTTKKS
jgi:hypothetical protein